jgi:hypothetical protein
MAQPRFVMTHAVPYFPAMVIYGMLLVAGGDEFVELIDIVLDEDYFDIIENDPDS